MREIAGTGLSIFSSVLAVSNLIHRILGSRIQEIAEPPVDGFRASEMHAMCHFFEFVNHAFGTHLLQFCRSPDSGSALAVVLH